MKPVREILHACVWSEKPKSQTFLEHSKRKWAKKGTCSSDPGLCSRSARVPKRWLIFAFGQLDKLKFLIWARVLGTKNFMG